VISKLWLEVSVLTLVTMLLLAVFFPQRVHAIALVQTVNGQAAPGTTVSATLSAATANNTIVAVCGATTSVTLSITAGGTFSTAINQAGTPSQGIFYKVSTGGETTITCTSSASTRLGIHVYEYSGMETTSVLDGTPGSNSGNSTSPSTGSTTTSVASTVLVGGLTVAGNDAFTTWTNTFTERNDFTNTGAAGSRGTYGGADRIVTATGTYSTGATIGTAANWRGQVAAFKGTTGALSVDIVNGSGVSVGSPSVSMSAVTIGFDCQTSTGTLGTTSERIRVTNTTATPGWTVAIAATSGNTSLWTSGGNNFDFNDGSGAPAGCADGGDADTRPGRMTLNPSAGTSTPQSGCNNTGITLGSSNSFAQGTTDSITLISASGSAGTNCYWELTGVSVSQTIPIQQATGTYTINLTLTVTAV
jgi:hypothetical protein